VKTDNYPVIVCRIFNETPPLQTVDIFNKEIIRLTQ